MFEAMRKRMGEAGARVKQADSETLWMMVRELAPEIPLAGTILAISEIEHWTVQHTALALAYAHMVLTSGYSEDINELAKKHCAHCHCGDRHA